MSWVEKAHRKNRIRKQIDAEMKDPKYQIAEMKKYRMQPEKRLTVFF